MRFNKLRYHDKDSLFLEESSFDLSYFSESDDESNDDDETVDTVEDSETEESIMIYGDCMMESAQAIAALHEIDALCSESYSKTTDAFEQYEIEVLYENKITDYIKKIAEKLKNAMKAIMNWVKQNFIKIYNKLKGKVKVLASSHNKELKNPEHDEMTFKTATVFKKNYNLKNAITSSELYKKALEVEKLINEVKKATDEEASAIKIPDIDIEGLRNAFVNEYVEIRRDVVYKDIKQQVIAIAPKCNELLKENEATVNLLLNNQIKKINSSLNAMNGDSSNKAHKLSTLLMKQNHILQVCASAALTASRAAIESIASVGYSVCTANKHADDDVKQAANESLLLSLESKLVDL